MPTTGYNFLCKIVPGGGSFAYSTHVPLVGYLDIDGSGQAYIGSFGTANAPVHAFNSAGSDTLYTVKLAGDGQNYISDIAVDKDQNIYIVGSTTSTNIASKDAYKTMLSGSSDIMVAKFGTGLVVEVLQDSLKHHALPMPDIKFDIYSVNLANSTNPLTYIETRSTDKKGFLHLPSDKYQPGMPVLIRNTPEKRAANKKDSKETEKYMYKLHLDNLIINKDGTISSQLLKAGSTDTTRVYLSHTSLGFNLSVSTEWKVTADYVDKLKTAFTSASNMLYDVTNGHAYIDYVTIYDDTANWKNSDIHIYANNEQWPEAVVKGINEPGNDYVYLPPAFYDNGTDFRHIQKFYDTNPVDPSSLSFIPALVHELGHYAFGFYDEYLDATEKQIYPDANFGFMDDSFTLSDPRSTEMSDYVPSHLFFIFYTETAQYFYRDHNCWDYFKDSFDKDFGLLLARINTPKTLGINLPSLMKGPNDNLSSPDFSVGSMMKIDVKAATTIIPTKDYRFSDKTGNPKRVKVCLEKAGTKRWIIHGSTTLTGRIRLFNVEPGDKILTAGLVGNTWKYVSKLNGIPTKKALADEEIVEMNKVNGQFYSPFRDHI